MPTSGTCKSATVARGAARRAGRRGEGSGAARRAARRAGRRSEGNGAARHGAVRHGAARGEGRRGRVDLTRMSRLACRFSLSVRAPWGRPQDGAHGRLKHVELCVLPGEANYAARPRARAISYTSTLAPRARVTSRPTPGSPRAAVPAPGPSRTPPIRRSAPAARFTSTVR